MYKVKQFFKRIYNLYRWFPIIWNDQDWDDHYIFEILKFKLKNQAEYIGGKDRYIGAKRDAEIMMLCTRLIDKIQDEWYGREYLDYQKSFHPLTLQFHHCLGRYIRCNPFLKVPLLSRN